MGATIDGGKPFVVSSKDPRLKRWILELDVRASEKISKGFLVISLPTETFLHVAQFGKLNVSYGMHQEF